MKSIETAIVISAFVLGASYILGNLHKLMPSGHDGAVYRINTVTGDVIWCVKTECVKTKTGAWLSTLFAK